MLLANSRDQYAIEPLGVELGIWQGWYQNVELPWLRWWDASGNLLLTGAERAQTAESLLEQERQRSAELERRLRELGIDV